MKSRTGYVDCSCRDCFDIAIGPLGTLCHDCADAGCDAFYTDCQRSDAYGADDEAEPDSDDSLGLTK